MKSNIELGPGDVLCNECDGSGYTIVENENKTNAVFEQLNIICPKCYGRGKLDWIENIVGRQKLPPLEINFPDMTTKNYADFQKEYICEFVDEAAKNIAQDIDKELLKKLTKSAEKIWMKNLY